jgi:hypothetical protein
MKDTTKPVLGSSTDNQPQTGVCVDIAGVLSNIWEIHSKEWVVKNHSVVR